VAAQLEAAVGAPAADLRFDIAITDGRPENPLAAAGSLIVARRDGTLDESALPALLERLPANLVIGRAYRRDS
jgi:hypothetical protein